MKKKILFLILVLSLVFTFGCSNNENVNTNDNPNNDISDNTNINTELSTERMINIYSNIADYMKDISKGNEMKEKKLRYKETSDTSTLSSMVALIKLGANLYENENFILTDKFVDFNITIDNNKISMYFKNEYSIENNKIYTALIVNQFGEVNDKDSLLMYFDIDYNFETDEILSFEIRQIIWDLDIDLCNLHCKYEDNKFYEMDPEDADNDEGKAVLDETIRIKYELRGKANDVISLDYNFSNEYMDAMGYAFN